ncbi:hypothetical protein DFH07DRAFT_737316 [Mycena maculata]|uniref:DUF7702 domain-containing protein n=1 Tax=Mycena maculata TaxID=230809 RepID=A0AAD7JJT2_9AGAR|nr:hypothetical protein DFH07DRAFT_737316 [Mycena maculata]
MSSTDYATDFGYHSVLAAVVFALVYLPIFLWFVFQSVKNTTYVYISLSVFCLMRVAAFGLRAVLIKSTSLGENLNVFIADEVMFGVGFFALLYSAFTLVLDREIMSGAGPTNNLPLKIMRDRRMFRVVLIIGIALGVMGISDSTSSNPSKASSGVTLHRASTIIFLVLTGIQALQTALMFQTTRRTSYAHLSFGDRHGNFILVLISIFLLVREVFMTATINNAGRQDEELLWYPFIAVPEVLAVICYAVPGLVPARSELKKLQADAEYALPLRG